MIPPGFSISGPVSDAAVSLSAESHRCLMLPPGLMDSVAQKLSQNEDSHASNGSGVPSHVNFQGAYLVKTSIGARYLQYSILVNPRPTTNSVFSHNACTMHHRYASFALLRKRLLHILSRCQRTHESPWSSLVHRSCLSCRAVRKTLAKIPFPHKTWCFTTLEDVAERAILLTNFVNACISLLVDWEGCPQSKAPFARALGAFLGVEQLAKHGSAQALQDSPMLRVLRYQDEAYRTTLSCNDDDELSRPSQP